MGDVGDEDEYEEGGKGGEGESEDEGEVEDEGEGEDVRFDGRAYTLVEFQNRKKQEGEERELGLWMKKNFVLLTDSISIDENQKIRYLDLNCLKCFGCWNLSYYHCFH